MTGQSELPQSAEIVMQLCLLHHHLSELWPQRSELQDIGSLGLSPQGTPDSDFAVTPSALPSLVDHKLFHLANVQNKFLSWHHGEVPNLLQICLLIDGGQSYHGGVISKLDNEVGVLLAHTIGCVDGIQKGAEHTSLRGPSVESERPWKVMAHSHHQRSARQEIQDPEFADQPWWVYGVKSKTW